jgi:hypothetical protein
LDHLAFICGEKGQPLHEETFDTYFRAACTPPEKSRTKLELSLHPQIGPNYAGVRVDSQTLTLRNQDPAVLGGEGIAIDLRFEIETAAFDHCARCPQRGRDNICAQSS